MPVLSVPCRRNVRLLLLSAQFLLHSPVLQTGPRHVVEVDDKQIRCGYLQGISALLGLSDHDHLRGEVCMRFSALPSDVADQNPHDGCHRLHHHNRDSGHLSDLSTQGIDVLVLFGRVIFCRCFSVFLLLYLYKTEFHFLLVLFVRLFFLSFFVCAFSLSFFSSSFLSSSPSFNFA